MEKTPSVDFVNRWTTLVGMATKRTGERSTKPGEPLPRRDATVREAKAMAHPLRLRIMRLCGEQELTNKQLADRLNRDPGTVLYHVRLLADAGLLERGPA